MKIFLPVDGSVHALTAVHHALQLVRGGLKATFVLANVQVPPSLYEVMVVHDASALDELRTSAGAELLHAAEAMLDAAGQAYESEVAGGYPGNMLVELIENYGCDMVVMGARGMGETTAPLGTVAQALLQDSPVPVTLVRPPRPSGPEA
ncbi:MAG: universal stress protein UspA [Leptothrix sp. (in: Bacteria)]|nr:universal stress protein UspA [Leptothrix sp. (in: b-proteobacteria)]